MYTATIVTLVLIGFVASSAYVLTWTPAVIRARRHDMTSLTAWEITDFAALPAACFLILALNIVNMLHSGVQPAATTGLAIQRICTTALITGIVLLRGTRWALTYRRAAPEERAIGVPLIRHRDERSS